MSGYEFMTWGNCLGGLIPNGSFMKVDPRAEIHVGDIVAVALKRHGPFARFVRSLTVDDLLGVTKIFLGSRTSTSGETVYLVGQLNPPIVSPIPESALEALHLVVGGQPPANVDAKMNDEDNAAQDLLGLFLCDGGPCAPVNPDWQPPGEGELSHG